MTKEDRYKRLTHFLNTAKYGLILEEKSITGAKKSRLLGYEVTPTN